MSRRSTELALLIAASPIIILLFILAILNDSRPLNIETLAVPIALFAAFIASHLAVRKFAPNADAALLPIVFVLSGIGIAFVMRLAPELATRQILWLFVGIFAMILTLIAVPSIRKLARYKYLLMLLGIILLLLPIFLGTEKFGSKIWLTLGDFSFQPGEIAKVLIVLFLAGYLADNREMLSVGGRRIGNFTIPDFRTLMPLLIMWAVSLLIVVFERDLGSALLFFGLFLVMIYISTGRKVYVIFGGILAVVGVVAAFFLFAHVHARVDIWLDPYKYAHGNGAQLVQSFYSLADGGLIGSGIGRGMPDFITFIESDFIFIAMAEEMGLFGASAILLLFVLFTVRGLAVAARAKSDVDAFCAAGLTAAIALQAFVIVGGVTSVIPLTGVTLPFMSQGGSSLLASFIIVGLLLRAGDSGTGHGSELEGIKTYEGGILGRVTLGRRLTILVSGFAVLFAVLIGNLTWHMVINAENVRGLEANSHTLERNTNIQRGNIATIDNVVLATSEKDADGNWQRVYPQETLATHAVGYMTPLHGSSGIENQYSEMLAGEQGFDSWQAAVDAMSGKEIPGNNVYLTIDSRIQQAAQTALEGQHGGVVVMDAQSGAVLAMASAPTYNLNDIEAIFAASNAGGASTGTGTGTDGSTGTDANGSTAANGDTENSQNPSQPVQINPEDLEAGILYNRCTEPAKQGLYVPGSTFKTVTLACALGKSAPDITLDNTYSSPSKINIGTNIKGEPGEITNFQNDAHGTLSVKRALELSSNTVFAQVADAVGPDQLVATAEAFGFNKVLNTDFYVATSLMPDPAEMTEWETAWAGVGQPVGVHSSPSGPVMTVTQLAMIGAGIANDGTVMTPYLMDHITSPDGTVLETANPSVFNVAVTPEVAAQVQEAMAGVVSNGTGSAAQISGYTVYAKTGTAETGREKDNSCFVGFVEINGRDIVVAVVLEEVGAGAATPKGRDVLQAAINALEA